jgi:hypothetical protein
MTGKRRRQENSEAETTHGEDLERAKRRKAEDEVRRGVEEHTVSGCTSASMHFVFSTHTNVLNVDRGVVVEVLSSTNTLQPSEARNRTRTLDPLPSGSMGGTWHCPVGSWMTRRENASSRTLEDSATALVLEREEASCNLQRVSAHGWLKGVMHMSGQQYVH